MTSIEIPRGAVARQQSLARLAAPAGVTAAVAGLAGFVLTHNPHTHTLSTGCPFLAVTGFYCPGCGGTRAVYDLMVGDFGSAVSMNAFVVFVFVPLAVIGFGYWWGRSLGWRLPAFNPPSWAIWSAVGAIAAFWVVRNLPSLVQVLSPQPF